MSTYRLSELLSPKSVVVIGGSSRESSVGLAVLRNICQGGFAGQIYLVNSKYPHLNGIKAVPSVADLPVEPDLAILTTPAHTIPQLVEALGKRGCKSAVVISAGLGRGEGSIFEGARLAARRYGLRIVGPNCIGVLSPLVGLNASFAAHMPRAGDLALISQSGAIISGVIEWAAPRGIGFSGIVSVGDQMDVDFGDLLDHFANDGRTRAILMYVESVQEARKFMSAARIAARTKPVVVLKAGRFEQGAKAAATHTGAMAGSDSVYEAAFRRAGLLRVFDLSQLFQATEILSAVRPFNGARLAVLTNGGGLGVLAVDKHIELGGQLATLSEDLIHRLDQLLPSNWSRGNPIDVIGDADSDRYGIVLRELLADPRVDGIVVMNVATSLASPLEIAKRVAAEFEQHRQKLFPPKPLLAVWVADDPSVREIFSKARIPLFLTESAAVQAFSQLVRYARAQDALRATPPKLSRAFSPDREAAAQVIKDALSGGQQWLSSEQIRALFAAYAVPAVGSVVAPDAGATGKIAESMIGKGSAVALKIVSPDIVHKSDVGGVRLNVRSREDAEKAAGDIVASVNRLRPDARITGILVQEMVELPNAREVIVGVADDPVFGRVIVFGQGGVSVEVVHDKAIALPPLDLNLARSLIEQTRVSRLLDAYRNVPAARRGELEELLVKVSQLVSDFPEIVEMDLNPILVNSDRLVVLDTRILIRPFAKSKGAIHLAIRAYPNEWEQAMEYDGGGEKAFVRPLRPEDEGVVQEFLSHITEHDLRLRFFNAVKAPGHAFLARLTQLDYARAMAFAAFDPNEKLLGVVRLHADANYETGEYAILVRSDLKGKGLGWKLMELIIRYARSEGLKTIEGHVLAENTTMLNMCEKLGFNISDSEGEADVKHVWLTLGS